MRFDGVVVDKEHLEVAATNERFADVLAEADDGHDGTVGKGGRELLGGAVVLQFLDGAPRVLCRIGGAQHTRRQPPDGTARRLPVDEAPAGGDQPGRIVAERHERTRRLLGDERRPLPRGPSNHPQPLDGVHR